MPEGQIGFEELMNKARLDERNKLLNRIETLTKNGCTKNQLTGILKRELLCEKTDKEGVNDV